MNFYTNKVNAIKVIEKMFQDGIQKENIELFILRKFGFGKQFVDKMIEELKLTKNDNVSR